MSYNCAIKQGSGWSIDALADGWGPDTSDETVTELVALVIERFDALCAAASIDAYWTPSTSEVIGTYGQDIPLTLDDFGDNPLHDQVDTFREQALAEVWAAVCGEAETEDGAPIPATIQQVVQGLDWD